MASGMRVGGAGHVWARRSLTYIPLSKGKHSILVSPVHSQCVTKAGMQQEMENRPSSYHLITCNSSHCAEEITAVYDCLLPIHVSMMVQRETVCQHRQHTDFLSVLSAGLSSLFSERTHTEQRGRRPVLMKMKMRNHCILHIFHVTSEEFCEVFFQTQTLQTQYKMHMLQKLPLSIMFSFCCSKRDFVSNFETVVQCMWCCWIGLHNIVLSTHPLQYVLYKITSAPQNIKQYISTTHNQHRLETAKTTWVTAFRGPKATDLLSAGLC